MLRSLTRTSRLRVPLNVRSKWTGPSPINSYVIDSPQAWDRGVKYKLVALGLTGLTTITFVLYYNIHYKASLWEPLQKKYVMDVSADLKKEWKREWSDAEYADEETRKIKAKELLEKAIEEKQNENKRFYAELTKTVEMYKKLEDQNVAQ